MEKCISNTFQKNAFQNNASQNRIEIDYAVANGQEIIDESYENNSHTSLLNNNRTINTTAPSTAYRASTNGNNGMSYTAATELLRIRNLNKRQSLPIFPDKLSIASINALKRAGRIKNFGEIGKPLIIGPKSPIRHLICSPGLELKDYKANIILMYKGSCGNNGSCDERKVWAHKNHVHYIVNTINCKDHISRLVTKIGFEFFSSFVLQTKERQMQVISTYNMQKI